MPRTKGNSKGGLLKNVLPPLTSTKEKRDLTKKLQWQFLVIVTLFLFPSNPFLIKIIPDDQNSSTFSVYPDSELKIHHILKKVLTVHTG